MSLSLDGEESSLELEEVDSDKVSPEHPSVSHPISQPMELTDFLSISGNQSDQLLCFFGRLTDTRCMSMPSS